MVPHSELSISFGVHPVFCPGPPPLSLIYQFKDYSVRVYACTLNPGMCAEPKQYNRWQSNLHACARPWFDSPESYTNNNKNNELLLRAVVLTYVQVVPPCEILFEA